MAGSSTSAKTIFALSSAPGRAGVAVVRVSGPAAGEAVARLSGDVPAARRAALRQLRDPGSEAEIDQGLVLWFPGPHSFTGEDLAEFQVHGGRAVVAALLAALGRVADCRLAEPGEFAMRAFENGKIDLAVAEGLADLIDAETEAQRRQAIAQAAGGLSRLAEAWRDQLVAAMALMEAAIDFSDEGDVAADAVAQSEAVVRRLAGEIARHLDDRHRGEILRDGFKVVLAGAPNVGKSSLMNALARRDVAIVSAEAGTTRDVIEVRLDLGGVPVIFADTAGLRADASGDVEAEGMRRTLDRAREADLVCWVSDDGEAQLAVGGGGIADGPAGVLHVVNKCDLRAGGSAGPRLTEQGDGGVLHVSARTGEGLDRLTQRIADIAKARLGGADDFEPAVITQARHRRHMEHCHAALEAFLQKTGDEELRAEDLRLAADSLGRITGRVDAEDVLDQVFGRFCIGK